MGGLLALALVAGCAGGAAGKQGEERAGGAPSPAPTSPAATADPRSPSPTPTGPVTVAFGGDVHFEDEIAARLAENPETALGPIASVLSDADVAMVNLETAITTGGDPAPKKYTFRAPPAAFRALDAAGVDVVTMANNHGMDFGLEGLRDSLDAARQHDFPVVGIGRDAEQAYAPHMVTVGGQRLAFIGVTQVMNLDLLDEWTSTEDQPGLASAKQPGLESLQEVQRLVRTVRAADERAGAVIVYLHWGRSGEPCPLPRQQRLARTLIDAGADVLVGAHAHRLLAGGFLRGSYVHYGLGNFVWYNADGVSGRTGVLTLTLRGDQVLEAKWTPATISGGVPRVLTGSAAEEAREEWKDLRECTDLSATPTAG